MKNSFDFIKHTRKLLEYGIFHHLTDETLSILHHLVMNGEHSNANHLKIFEYWYQGDFSENPIHIQLLHETNFILTCNGNSKIEENFIELTAY